MIPDKLTISSMVRIAHELGYRNRNGDTIRTSSVVIAARRSPERVGAIKEGDKYTGLWYICDYDKFFSWLGSFMSNSLMVKSYADQDVGTMIELVCAKFETEEKQLL